MNGGLQNTLKVLGQTGNETALSLLIPALDSPQAEIREGAMPALLTRRSLAGQRELLRRWHTFDERWKKLIAERPGRMSSAVREAIHSGDTLLYANGCAAVLLLCEFDLIPALIQAAEDAANPEAHLAARTTLNLAELLYLEISGPRDYSRRRDPHLLRQHVVSCLELSVARFGKHRQREIVEAFLLLTNRDNTTLKRILQDQQAGAHADVVDLLTHSARPGVMRLVLSFLDDPQAPLSGMNVLSRRGDEPFLKHLLAKIGVEPSHQAKVNLKRLESIVWLRERLSTVDSLDEAQQHATVQFAVGSSMNRLQVYRLIERLLKQGTPGGRRAASTALAQFKGNDANQLVLRALADVDPLVQANALLQLRERGIAGAMTILIEALESREPLVRAAAQQSLAEFSFKRYLGAFDVLDPEVRRSTGSLVKSVDPTALDGLLTELASAARSRRLRGIEMARSLDVLPQVEDQLIELLSDEDHFVRAEAASALAQCDSPSSREALREALLDRSVAVQEAAEFALRSRAELPDGELPVAVKREVQA